MIEIPESVETWEETEKTIGETLPVIYGADAATLGWIRQWNEVIEADCPLYYDEELAQRLGYKTIPAPAGMAMAVGTASWWEPWVEEGRVGPLYPLAMPMLVPTPRHSLGFATDTEVEFLRPLYPGDTLRQVGRLVSVTRKRLKVGDGAFFTVEIEFINQNDETVAIQRVTTWSGNPVEEGE